VSAILPQYFLTTAVDSIPHASSAGNGHNNGHQIISISPTNSTSPVNKESGLANDENTNVPEDRQLPESGIETIVDQTKITGATTTETTTTESKINKTETPATAVTV